MKIGAKRTRWMNVYECFSTIHNTKRDADEKQDWDRISPAVRIDLRWDGKRWQLVAPKKRRKVGR